MGDPNFPKEPSDFEMPKTPVLMDKEDDAPTTPKKKPAAKSPQKTPQTSKSLKSKGGTPKASPKSKVKPTIKKVPACAKPPKKKTEKKKEEEAVVAPKAKSKNKKLKAQEKKKAEEEKKRQAAEEKKKEEEKKKKAEEKKKKEKGLKRPAANVEQAGKSTSWTQGIAKTTPAADEQEDGQEDEEADADFQPDPIVEPDTTKEQRDRSKTNKFMTMLKAGQLPEYIQQEWEKTESMKTGKREQQSLIINSLFDRSTLGRLIMNDDKPFFRSMQESYQERSDTKRLKTLPRLLFMGKYNLTEEKLKEGVAKGEFLEIKEGDTFSYAFQTAIQDFKTGFKSGMGWDMGKEGDKKQLKAFQGLTANQNPFKGLTMPTPTGSSTDASAPLAIQDQDHPLVGDQWKLAQDQIAKATEALNKMEKEGIRHLTQVGDDRSDPLFDCL